MHQELGAVTVLNVLNLHQVVGVNALAGGGRIQLGLVLGGFLGADGLAALKHLLHTLKDDHQALAAGIHNAGFFQHGQLVGGVVQRTLAGAQHQLPQFGRVGNGRSGGLFPGHTGHGEDGALGGLHHGLVRALHTLLQSLHQIGGGGFLLAFQRLGEAAEQQAGDHAGVAAGAAQHGGSSGFAGLGHGAAVRHGLQLGHAGAHGHGHVGAGVTVGHGEHVQLVHAGALVLDVVGAGNDGVTQDLEGNRHSLLHLKSSCPQKRGRFALPGTGAAARAPEFRRQLHRPRKRPRGPPSARWRFPPRCAHGEKCSAQCWSCSGRSPP